MRSTETTFSSLAVEKIVTPLVARLASRTPLIGTRINWPPSETSMIWSLSSIGKVATSWPISAVFEVSVARMPLPPRPEVRKS
ncbi:hypothetical protein D3C78_1853900 [compost metagenome]